MTNTSDLYTGTTSGSYGINRKIQKQRKDIKDHKNEVRSAILPAYERLVDDLRSEIDSLTNIETFMTGSYVTDDEVRFELAARRRYIAFLNSLISKYTNTAKGVRSEPEE